MKNDTHDPVVSFVKWMWMRARVQVGRVRSTAYIYGDDYPIKMWKRYPEDHQCNKRSMQC